MLVKGRLFAKCHFGHCSLFPSDNTQAKSSGMTLDNKVWALKELQNLLMFTKFILN